MNDQPTSGSRWEPSPPDHEAQTAAGASGSAAAPGPEPALGSQRAPVPPVFSGAELPSAPGPWADGFPSPATSRDVRRRGRRAWSAGLAALLLLGGSVGGYAIGHRWGDDVPPGGASHDAPRPGFGQQAPAGDGLGSRSDEPPQGLSGDDADDTAFRVGRGSAR